MVKNQSDSINFLIDNESINALVEFENLVKFENINGRKAFIRKFDAPLTWNYLFNFIDFCGSDSIYKLENINLNTTIRVFALAGIDIFSPSGINNFEFDRIEEIDDNKAIVIVKLKDHFLTTENKNVNVIKKFTFKKENETWKFNVISYFSLFDKLLITAANEQNIPPNEYVKQVFKK